jgi:outer membrane protein assembly factor BamB
VSSATRCRGCIRPLTLLAVLFLVGYLPAEADDWPNWRGPNFDGISTESLPAKLPEKLPVIWKRNVGIGFSSVSVQGERVLTMGNRDGRDTVICLDAATGETLWKHSYLCELDPKYYEGGPSATPTIHSGSVYSVSKKGHVFRLDLETGRVIWRRHLIKDHGFELPEWSFASSPFIAGTRVLLNIGRNGTALSKTTGETLWNPSLHSSGYATFVPFPVGRSTHALFSAKALLGIDSKTGRAIWSHPRPSSRDVNAADPIVIGNRIVVSSATGTELLAIGPEGTAPRTVWKQRGLRWYFNAGIRLDGHLYSIHGTTHRATELVCTSLATGEAVWSEEGFGSGALMATGKTVIVFDKGTLTLFPATPEAYRPIHSEKILDGKCWTVPVLANGQIYCRNSAGDIACVSVR